MHRSPSAAAQMCRLPIVHLALVYAALSSGCHDRNNPRSPTLQADDAAVVEASPLAGESGVATRRELILRLRGFVQPSSVTATAIQVRDGDAVIPTRLHVSPDRNTITAFPLQPWPSGRELTLQVVDGLLLADSGRPIDVDNDGLVGGSLQLPFRTVDLTRVPDTEVCGRVFASEPDGSGFDVPLAGALVTVDGLELDCFAVTDSLGNFCLQNAPAGDVFVHVRGSAAAGAPAGFFYPDVGKLWQTTGGQRVTVGTVFLPAVAKSALQQVSRSASTPVRIVEEQLQRVTDPDLRELLRRTEIVVPADSLFADDGARGGRVGIGPVNRDRLPGQPPEGLELPIVITIQTDGATNFDIPVPVSFPNLPNPISGELLPPGAKSALWSFNHDTGRFEVVGPMTVSADGLSVTTDPGVGVRAPGWHGSAPGTPGSSRPPRMRKEPPCNPSIWDLVKFGYEVTSQLADCAVELANLRQAWNCFLAWKNLIDAMRVQAENLITRLQSPGGVSAATAIQILHDLIAKKNAARDVAACIRFVSPATRISKVITCGQRALNVANAYCELQGSECLTLRGRDIVCSNIAKANGLINEAKKWSDSFKEWEEMGLDALVCQAVETATNLIGIFNPPASLEGGPQGPTPEELQELLQALQAILPTLSPSLAVEPAYPGAISLAPVTEDLAQSTAEGCSQATERAGSAEPTKQFYAIELGTAAPRRGTTTEQGTFSLMLGSNAFYRVTCYDPWHARIGFATGRTAPEGQSTTFHTVPLADSSSLADTDQDGMPDDAEFVVGTDMDSADTDDDGVPDLAEVLIGNDPLDGIGGRERVLADLPTVGPAVDLCAEDGALVTACGEAGIEVWNVWQNMTPASVARLDTPGTALRVACAGLRVAVADGNAGLACIDLSTPAQPVLRHQVTIGDVRAVAAANGVAFAGTQLGRVAVVDIDQGTVLLQRDLGTAIVDLQVDGEWVFALTGNALRVLRISGGVLLDAATLPIGRDNHRRLVRAQGNLVSVHWRGFVTIDITNPAAPAVRSFTDTAQLGWRHLALDGSGNAVAVVGLNSNPDASDDLRLYQLPDLGQPGVFTRDFTGPEFPNFAEGTLSAVAIYNGLAYSSDRRGRLFCVRYRLRDFGNEPPQALLTTTATGGSIEEGKVFVVRAETSDDVQVSHVDFEVDGTRLVTDGTYPFELRLVAPPLATTTSLVVGAKCWDTAGNLRIANSLLVSVTSDSTPPALIRTAPASNGVALANSPLEFVAAFSEPIHPTTVHIGSLLVAGAGPDALLGTSDDQPLVTMSAQWRPDLQIALWTFAGPLSQQRYRAVLAGITDVAGNALPTTTLDFTAYSGLRSTFFGATSNTALTTFFAGMAPTVVTERRANLTPQATSTTIVPSVHFPTVNGPWAIHAGANGQFLSTNLSAPVGDDITWNVPDVFGILVEGMLRVPQAGNVTFSMTIDDAFVLELNGQIVFQHLGCQAPTTFVSGPIALPMGPVTLRIAAADVCGSQFNLTLAASGAGFPGGVLPPSAFSAP